MGTWFRRSGLTLMVALLITSMGTLGAEAAGIKNKATGETIKGTLTDQSINGLRVFVVEGTGEKKFVNLDEWEVIAPEATGPAATETAAPASATPAEKGAPGTVYFVEVPIVGEVGKDVSSEGVKSLFKAAAGSGVKHIVFRIKTPGGSVATARDIREIMKSYEDRFQYHALIEDCISAGIWVAFSCHTIHMADGSSFGGAVAYTKNIDTGSAEVDSKMNSILTAEEVAAAEAKGHSGVLVQAMMVMASEAYAWTDDKNKIQISNHAPAEVPPERMLLSDTAETVLTLTQSKAVAIGAAKPLRGDTAGLGDDLGYPGWKQALAAESADTLRRAKTMYYKEQAAKEALDKKRDQNVERRNATILFIEQTLRQAEKNDPANGTYYVKEDTGHFTAASQQQWKKATDQAISDWQRVMTGVKTWAQLEKEADALGLERAVNNLNLNELWTRAQREIQRLKSDRNKMTV